MPRIFSSIDDNKLTFSPGCPVMKRFLNIHIALFFVDLSAEIVN